MLVQKSSNILRVRSFWFLRPSVFATFDRKEQQAKVTRFGFFSLLERHTIPFRSLAGVQIRKMERGNGATHYGVRIETRVGNNHHIACRSRDQAMRIAQEIQNFLHMELRD